MPEDVRGLAGQVDAGLRAEPEPGPDLVEDAGRVLERRAELDQDYIQRLMTRVRELFPNSPIGREQVIAEHACQKYSGRVGRTAGAKNLDEKAILLAVTAHIRHTETDYDQLLAEGVERRLAREQVRDAIDTVLEHWKAK